jgi:hypothetical protein
MTQYWKLLNSSENIVKQTQCTPTHQELSNGTVEVMKTQHLNPELGQIWDEIF